MGWALETHKDVYISYYDVLRQFFTSGSRECQGLSISKDRQTGTRATVGANVLKIAVDCDGVIGDNTVVDGGNTILERVDIDLGIGEFLS